MLAVDEMCFLGRRRARAKQGGMRFRSLCFSDFREEKLVLTLASSRDWRPAIQASSPQRRRMDTQKVILLKKRPWRCRMGL